MRVETLTIDEIGSRGDGIGHTRGGSVYVPLAVAGDVVEAIISPFSKGSFVGEIKAILKPSPDRVDAKCKHFGVCGGCSLQHVGPKLYKGWIKSRVETALSHQGFEDIEIKDPIIVNPGTRRRVSLRALKVKGDITLGFNERKTHNIVDIESCPISHPILIEILPNIRNMLGNLLEEGQATTILMIYSETGIQLVLDLLDDPDLKIRELLGEFANVHDLGAVAVKVNGVFDLIAMRREPLIHFGSTGVPIPLGAFLQPSKEGEDALVSVILKEIMGMNRVLDLFSGLGTFGLRVAEFAQVHAVEGDQSLLTSLQNSANLNPKLKTLSTEHRDLFRRPLLAQELNSFDCVIFDPPRAGAKAQVFEFAKSSVPVIIGVSCNPNTFARDARMLVEGGYHLEYIQPVDQFLWSHHVELAAVFRNRV